MFRVEDGVGYMVDDAQDKYERHFNKIFPLYEYVDMMIDGDYDISVAGAKRLSTFIDGRIEADAPVEIPEGYEDRLY